jgi:Fe-Mn family superoxide dismutase
MAFYLPALPFPQDSLGNFISAETIEYHHGKHHKAYVEKTNDLLSERQEEGTLIEIVRAARRRGDYPLFNNSAQVWNHSFYWNCLAPATGQMPTGRLLQLILAGYGSVSNLLSKLADEAVAHFSNGWVWLVRDRGKLKIISLHDADTPIVYPGMKPMLALDVWEHAYYIDYRNGRADYARSVLENVINWEFVAENLDGDGERRADQPG